MSGRAMPMRLCSSVCCHAITIWGYTSAVGENMKYLVVDRIGRPLACLLFGSAAWSCSSRDDYIGWDRDARRRHIQYTTNNTRFLIVPWVSVAHLASHVLALICRRIAHDWYTRYGHTLYLLETFVDQTRFTGTCYRAANWQRIGDTRGRSRNDRNHRLTVAIKSVFVYPLSADFQQRLTS
ncbi:MAG: Druantia anti-phage system protein DruA [Gammaproteobacteria bacterium]